MILRELGKGLGCDCEEQVKIDRMSEDALAGIKMGGLLHFADLESWHYRHMSFCLSAISSPASHVSSEHVLRFI